MYIYICAYIDRKIQSKRLLREGRDRCRYIYTLIVDLMLFSNEWRDRNLCRWIRWVFLSWPFIIVVLYSFVLMLLDSIGSVNINHFLCGVCKVIDLSPGYMEQFAKLLTSILYKVIASDRIRKLFIWEAINPQDHRNKAYMVADIFIYPANIFYILLCAGYWG